MKVLELRISDHDYAHLREIANVRGTTVTDVATAAIRLLAREHIAPMDRDISRLHAAGLTTSQIARRLDVPNNAVSRRYRPLGISANPGGRQ